jgi:copper(I)-binding protein
MFLKNAAIGLLLVGGLVSVPQIVRSDSASLQVKDAWANPTASGQSVAAGYFVVHNRTNLAEVLRGASSPAAQNLQFHTSSLVGGVARMRKVERFNIPAGGQLKLAPGGNHLMLIGVKQQFKVGETVPVTLHFNSGASVKVKLEIKNADNSSSSNGGHHGHH